MKRAGNLWSKICDRDALRLAHKAARRGKLHYREVRWVDWWVKQGAQNKARGLKPPQDCRRRRLLLGVVQAWAGAGAVGKAHDG